MNHRVRIDPISALFALVEDACHPAHWGSLMFLENSQQNPDVFLGELLTAFRREDCVQAPFTWCMKRGLLGLWWQPCEDFNLSRHVIHHVLAAADEAVLLQQVAQIHSCALPANYPLWDCHIFSGFAEGQIALYFRVHHVMFDAQGIVAQMVRAFSDTADMPIRAPWQVPMSSSVGEGNRLVKRVRFLYEVCSAIIQQINYNRGGKAKRHAIALTAPKTPLTGIGSAERQVLIACWQLQELQAVRTRLQATLNDLFLLICSGALRHYLEASGELPTEPLIAFIPISVRQPQDGCGGNKISGAFINTASHLADVSQRLTLIQRSTQAAKQIVRSRSPAAAMWYWVLSLTPAIVLLPFQQIFERPSFNFVLSSFQVTDRSLFIGKSQITAVYPVNLLFIGQGAIVTFARYLDQVYLSLIVCPDLIPDADKLMELLTMEFIMLTQ